MLMHRTPNCENVSRLCVFQLSGTGFCDYIIFYNYPAMQHRTWKLLRVIEEVFFWGGGEGWMEINRHLLHNYCL